MTRTITLRPPARRRRWAALAALAALPVAHAAAPAPTGVWKGTIGGAAVMLCLPEAGEAEYYYLRHKLGLKLAVPGPRGAEPDALARAWTTGTADFEEQLTGHAGTAVTGRWRLTAKSGSELAGTWTAPQGGKVAPIALTRVSASAKPDARTVAGDCASAFYEPLRAAVQVKPSPATFERHAYRRLATEQAAALELPPDTPNADRFNRWALDWLRQRAVDAYLCNTGKGGVGDPLDASLEPVAWTPDYLVLRDGMPEAFCGGAHGNASLSYVTWSLPQGQPVDTWAWLRGGEKALAAQTNREGTPIRSGLSRLVVREHPRNVPGDSCSDAMDFIGIDAPYPTARGLTFHTRFGHAMRACNDEVAVTWKQLGPYLSDEGRAAMAKLAGPAR